VRAIQPSLDLWKDKGVPEPFQKAEPAFVPAGDIGVLIGPTVAVVTPYLASGKAGAVRRLFAALNKVDCIRSVHL